MKQLSTLMITQPPPSPPLITFPNPLSYEFRVVEYVDQGKIIKARLEVKINQHDQYGNMSFDGTWEEVPRVQR